MGILLCNSREGSSSSQSSINMSSKIRQNYHEECEALINKQVNMEMYASYVYLSMASYFARDDQALHGFSKFFKDNSNEERDHGIMFMDYQSSRGGRVVFQDIAKPTPTEWGTPLEAVEAALELEKTVNQSLLDLVGAAEKRNDPHLGDFIEEKFLDEQVKAVQQLSELVTKMKRAGV